MVDNSSTKPLTQTINHIFQELSATPKQRNVKLVDVWLKIVGGKIAGLTTPRFHGKGVVVWVRNSSFACELSQKYGAAILKRLQNEFGGGEVEKIWFCVGEPN